MPSCNRFVMYVCADPRKSHYEHEHPLSETRAYNLTLLGPIFAYSILQGNSIGDAIQYFLVVPHRVPCLDCSAEGGPGRARYTTVAATAAALLQLLQLLLLLLLLMLLMLQRETATLFCCRCCCYCSHNPRHSTIEVHPKFSEAPHLRSSIPHPITDFSKNQKASRRKLPGPKSTTSFFFEIKIGNPTISGQGTPSFRNNIAEMCFLYYRRTGHPPHEKSRSAEDILVYAFPPRASPGSPTPTVVPGYHCACILRYCCRSCRCSDAAVVYVLLRLCSAPATMSVIRVCC